MRDERAQHLRLPGDVIRHPALLAFICRNYGQDAQTCWYFQNGPQKVYVTLEATPFIARTDPLCGFVLHTGEPMSRPERAWITDEGIFILKENDRIAQIDDRDIAECLTNLRLDGAKLADERLLAWLADPLAAGHLSLMLGEQTIAVEKLVNPDLPAFFGYQPNPTAIAAG